MNHTYFFIAWQQFKCIISISMLKGKFVILDVWPHFLSLKRNSSPQTLFCLRQKSHRCIVTMNKQTTPYTVRRMSVSEACALLFSLRRNQDQPKVLKAEWRIYTRKSTFCKRKCTKGKIKQRQRHFKPEHCPKSGLRTMEAHPEVCFWNGTVSISFYTFNKFT